MLDTEKFDLEKSYDASQYESNIYQLWLNSGYFNPDNLPNQSAPPYSIILPPPNVTGVLHLGHALTLAIQDLLIRYHRMSGYKTLWLPGTDHAAIATQSKVEALLYKQNKTTRYDLGRDKFLEEVKKFAQESHDSIIEQVKRLGSSIDWSREAYTLDEPRTIAVQTAFKKLYDMELIYRGKRMVNWDPKLQTTVSDDEVEWQEETIPFYYLKYGPFVIGTSRPETKFGDKYVVMHPDDNRYANYKHGQQIQVDWINGTITATIIKDSAIDMEFGTGVMTITPWHDLTDNEIAVRHNLDFEQIIDLNGKLLPIAGEFAGLHIKKARPLIIERLQTKGLVDKIDDKYSHRVAINSRGGNIIEPQILKQWFINVSQEFVLEKSKIEGVASGSKTTLKQLMRHAVQSNQINIIPKHFDKTYFHWVDNLRDWCISRQIWYGHRLPVWYKDNQTHIGPQPPKTNDGWEQDPDTLDTWFSSGLWTFSTLNWPQSTTDLKTFHPTSVLETGYDILFFWVARMILMSTALLGEIPFKTVYLHGLVRDKERQKMSKSKGNIIDPLGVIETYGTDALRFALIFSTAAGNDIPLSEDKIKGMKHFGNKLWNIARFIINNLSEKEFSVSKQEQSINDLLKLNLTVADQNILEKLSLSIADIDSHITNFRLHEAAQNIYQFVWYEFADKYLEASKDQLSNLVQRKNTQLVLLQVLTHTLKLLHPFMPFITEVLWQKLKRANLVSEPLLMMVNWPKTDRID